MRDLKVWDIISKKPKLIATLVCFFWLILVATNFNRIIHISDYLSNESTNLSTSKNPESTRGSELIEEISNVNSSFQLILRNPNGTIFDEEMRDKIRNIINNITSNPKIGPYLSPKKPYSSVFDEADNLLRTVFATQWFATQMSFASVHYIWGGTIYYSTDWIVNYNATLDIKIASVLALEHTKIYIEQVLHNNNESMYFEKAQKFLDAFSTNFESYSNTSIPSNFSEALLISKSIVQNNQTILSELTQDARELYILSSISQNFNSSRWEENDYVYERISFYLFSSIENDTVNFVKEVYSNGDIEGFVRAKNKYLLPVLQRKIFLPPLTEDIIVAFLKQYTNFDGTNKTVDTTIILFNLVLDYDYKEGKDAYLELFNIFPILQEEYLPLELYMTGLDMFVVEITLDYENQVQKTDIIVILSIVLILFLVYRSPIIPFIQIFVLLIAFGVSRLLFIFIGNAIGGLSSTSLIILSVSMLGATTDYCVFILGDYMWNLKRNKKKLLALESTLDRTSKSITISAISLSFGFGALILSRFNLATGLGIGGVIGFLTSLAVSITLLPSILVLIDEKFLTKWKLSLKIPKRLKKLKIFTKKKPLNKKKFSINRQIKRAVDNPKKVLFAALIISAIGISVFLIIPTDYAQISTAPESYFTRQGIDAIENYLGTEYLSQITIVFKTPISESFLFENNTLNFASIYQVYFIVEEILSKANITQKFGVSHPLGKPYIESLHNASLFVEEEIKLLMKNFIMSDRTVALVFCGSQYKEGDKRLDEQVILIREEIKKKQADGYLNDWSVFVTGFAPRIYDAKIDIKHDFNLIFAFASITITLLLFFFLKNFLMSIRVLITIFVSLGISLGIFGVISWLFMGGSIYWLVPLMSYAVLTALGLDFDVLFLGIFINIYKKEKKLNTSIIKAVEQTMNNISVAGIIMAITYLSLLFTSSIHMQQLGLGLGIGILIDVFISRLFIVPPAVVVTFKPKKTKNNSGGDENEK
ncbi:MAG: MMPL family transporter [Candidatus Heimdallarchaeaceae archaeon]